MARLSTATRHKVVILHQQGLSQTKISKQTGVSRCAVQALLKKHKETGNTEDHRRSGQPRKLGAADERHIKLITLRNRKMSSSAITSELAETSGTQGEVFDVSLVPISISYERILEESLYAYELLGVPKPKESTSGLLKARKILSDDFGSIHVYFGHPVSLRSLAQGKISRSYCNLIPRHIPVKPPKDIFTFVNDIGYKMVRLQQENMVISPWVLVASILIQSLPQIDINHLTEQTVWLRNLAQSFGASVDWPDHISVSKVVASSISLHHSIVRNIGGRVTLIEEKQESSNLEHQLFNYAATVLMCASYRNQILHIFVRPALVAISVHSVGSSRKEEIFSYFSFLRDIFSYEFIFAPGHAIQDFEEGCYLLMKADAIQILKTDILLSERGHKIVSFFISMFQPFVEGYQVVCRYLSEEALEGVTENQYVSAVRKFAVKRLLSATVFDHIKADIQTAPFFAWQVDKETYISCHAQLSVIVRYMASAGKIQECFIGFLDVSGGRDAQFVFEVLNENMQGYSFKEKRVAQTYDGAAVFASSFNGLQAKVKVIAPSEVIVHCYAHRLNLVLSQGAKCLPESKIFFASLSGFTTFFSKSTKRMSFLESAGSSRLPRNAPTRWNFTSRTVSTVANNYDGLLQTFDKITQDESMDDNTLDAVKGFMKLEDFEFLFMLYTYEQIFSEKDVVFDIVQQRAMDVLYCKKRIGSLFAFVKEKRSEEAYQAVYAKAANLTSDP
ncbi:GNPAT acyltransferase, partial [Polypterus senegalus]